MEGIAGVTTIVVKTAAVTVRFVLPEMLPEVAVMLTDPGATVEAKP